MKPIQYQDKYTHADGGGTGGIWGRGYPRERKKTVRGKKEQKFQKHLSFLLE